jgi:thimet oligopeptidase
MKKTLPFHLVVTALLLTCGAAIPAWADQPPAADAPAAPAAGKPSPVAAAIQNANAAVKAIVDVPDSKRTFENTIGAIDDLASHLNADTTMLQFMQYVSTDAAERDAGSQATEDVTNYQIDLGKREDLYKAVKAYAATNPKLEGERARLLKFILRDYKREGMDLSPEHREKLKEVQKEITRLGLEFEKNIRDDASVLPCTLDDLKGMPEDYIKTLPRAGDAYLVGMAYPQYIPITELCESDATREKMWLLYKRRAGQKNVEVLEKILALRAEQARILGYKSAADFEEEVLMSKDSATVRKFYDDLRPIVRKKAEVDFKELQDAKRARTGDPKAVLQPWDYSFYRTKLLKEKYKVDPEVVKQYFPMQSVVDGLFSVTQKIYGLEYKEITAEAATHGRKLWHPDVRLFEVTDKASGAVLGEFAIDLHPRDNKFTHAAQWGLFERKTYMDGTVQKPFAALVCNFTKPTEDKPSLLTHEEVETFFHEFGHCLHTILTEATLSRFSGTSVERDFVEAPSQMFENWVWNAEVLNTFAKHYKTGEKMPKALIDGMIAAKHLGSGLDAQQQFFYGLTDLAYHSVPDGKVDTTKVANETYAKETLYQPITGVFFQASFGHLVGYQAGYYGYMWSLVYASDMFSRFKQQGLLNPEVGMDYRKKILAKGGTIDGLDLVRGFLGREPNLGSFLDHLGLKEEKSAGK